jgi:hypothetical protein
MNLKLTNPVPNVLKNGITVPIPELNPKLSQGKTIHFWGQGLGILSEELLPYLLLLSPLFYSPNTVKMRLIKFLIPLILFSSCAKKVAYTVSLQQEYNFTESSLKKVQFYTSEEIVLKKSKSGDNVVIGNGQFLIKNESDFEYVVIKKGSPCVLVKMMKDNLFLVSFEVGDDKLLAFGSDDSYYSLLAKEWKDRQGTVSYAGKQYVTGSGGAFLLVKIKSLKRVKSRERVLTGRKIN